MFALVQVGTYLESLVGSARMLAIYAVALIGSGIAVVLFSPNDVTVGASGAIFGLFGALVAVGIRLGPRRARADRADAPDRRASISRSVSAMSEHLERRAHRRPCERISRGPCNLHDATAAGARARAIRRRPDARRYERSRRCARAARPAAERRSRGERTAGRFDRRLFAPDGSVARALPGFEARPGQVQMAQTIERGFLEGVHTIVEAGTGVGKSLAYLVPALRSGKKVVVSTGTIALQEQLVRKDIPLVVAALGRPVRVELLKGRNRTISAARSSTACAPSGWSRQSASMERLWAWAERTATGDRAELPFVPPAARMGSARRRRRRLRRRVLRALSRLLFLRAPRRGALRRSCVVVNHALFFLDLAGGRERCCRRTTSRSSTKRTNASSGRPPR